MLTQLLQALETATGLVPYPFAGAPDEPRQIVYSVYSVSSAYADDLNILDVPKIQLDLWTQTDEDTLPDQVTEVLRTWRLPYSIETLMMYDDETNRLRTIVQTEVL